MTPEERKCAIAQCPCVALLFLYHCTKAVQIASACEAARYTITGTGVAVRPVTPSYSVDNVKRENTYTGHMLTSAFTFNGVGLAPFNWSIPEELGGHATYGYTCPVYAVHGSSLWDETQIRRKKMSWADADENNGP
ncbi:hypothetical protein B0T22DRAFT_439197 [Podospora appendiculata]|uniref:Uncharacterized protein n=1 Tax=Podospora appendiculata TaxID=314037 RepID=A0AAE0WYF7_9PEZI|nr:hypothetical protein B0T22DRAFT_446047 [Podospora appendiculata]KAK3687584.1 hypothetical protein B0T22DRAFT_439197 [Podospora appendiculata]